MTGEQFTPKHVRPSPRKTVFECHKEAKDVNKSLRLVHYAETETQAIAWLEKNGGGVYRNTLHNFSMEVKTQEKNAK